MSSDRRVRVRVCGVGAATGSRGSRGAATAMAFSTAGLIPIRSVRFHSIPVHSVPFRSSAFRSIPFQSSPFQSSPVDSGSIRFGPFQSSPVPSVPVQSSPFRPFPSGSALPSRPCLRPCTFTRFPTSRIHLRRRSSGHDGTLTAPSAPPHLCPSTPLLPTGAPLPSTRCPSASLLPLMPFHPSTPLPLYSYSNSTRPRPFGRPRFPPSSRPPVRPSRTGQPSPGLIGGAAFTLCFLARPLTHAPQRLGLGRHRVPGTPSFWGMPQAF
jgi:hypothetical protein